jgi:hypothetical protein
MVGRRRRSAARSTSSRGRRDDRLSRCAMSEDQHEDEPERRDGHRIAFYRKRAGWLDQVNEDPATTNAIFRVAWAILQFLSPKTRRVLPGPGGPRRESARQHPNGPDRAAEIGGAQALGYRPARRRPRRGADAQADAPVRRLARRPGRTGRRATPTKPGSRTARVETKEGPWIIWIILKGGKILRLGEAKAEAKAETKEEVDRQLRCGKGGS